MILLETAASTNATAAAEPRPGTVVVADHQSAGRGRLDRTWETPPGTALTFSVVVDPGLDDVHWPLLPLAVALAAADGLRAATGLPVAVKWPNDLLLPTGGEQGGDQGKVAGILLERVAGPTGPLAVIGIGINVGLGEADLPVPTATSTSIAGSDADRTEVFGAVMAALGPVLSRLAADPAAVLDRYRDACDTLGREVEVQLPDGERFTGLAQRLDDSGRLVVAGRAVGAGDVVHVRPA